MSLPGTKINKTESESSDKSKNSSNVASSSGKTRERRLHRLKVVLRRLPRGMTEEELVEQLDPLPDSVRRRWFCPADPELIPFAYARAYFVFIDEADAIAFCERFSGYVFMDKLGNESMAIAEQAPFSDLPKFNQKERDKRINTIDNDPEYKCFLEEYNNVVVKKVTDFDALLRELEEKRNNTNYVKPTPLTEFVKQNYAAGARMLDRDRHRHTGGGGRNSASATGNRVDKFGRAKRTDRLRPLGSTRTYLDERTGRDVGGDNAVEKNSRRGGRRGGRRAQAAAAAAAGAIKRGANKSKPIIPSASVVKRDAEALNDQSSRDIVRDRLQSSRVCDSADIVDTADGRDQRRRNRERRRGQKKDRATDASSTAGRLEDAGKKTIGGSAATIGAEATKTTAASRSSGGDGDGGGPSGRPRTQRHRGAASAGAGGGGVAVAVLRRLKAEGDSTTTNSARKEISPKIS